MNFSPCDTAVTSRAVHDNIYSSSPTVSCLSVVHLWVCLLEACLHLMKNVIWWWWACLTQVGNKLNKVSFLFCITVILFTTVSVSLVSVYWIQRLAGGCKLNIHAAEWTAAIALHVCWTLINNMIFTTRSMTLTHMTQRSHQVIIVC